MKETRSTGERAAAAMLAPGPAREQHTAPAAVEPTRAAHITADLPSARPSGVKAVLARLPFEFGLQIPDPLQPLAAKLRHASPRVDLRQVIRAYVCAERAHNGRAGESGEPFTVHPVGVAETLADLGMDTSTIVAALLHDVVEDTVLTIDDLEAEFGEQVAMLVEGISRLGCVRRASHRPHQAEALRKMLMAMATDYRVLLIKLADRLHNMRTIHHLPRERQRQAARETLEIYAPLAQRLGMQQFKRQLEDLAFATMHPKRCDELKSMVRERQLVRDRYLKRIVAEVGRQLRSVKIRAEIMSRPRHYYAIYERMVRQRKEFSEIYDVVGIRVIVDDVADCYAALGAVHARWHPIPGRFKDYIAMPKLNLYQSLHTTVVGPDARTVEVQIRTQAMHQTAEYGIAAHWKYRDGTEADRSQSQWLAEMIDMQPAADVDEILSNLRVGLNPDEVFVFTPRGEVKALPRGATPVDFAYAIHTEVGHRTVGARINGQQVELDRQLRDGETVQIMTTDASGAAPRHEWLEFARSSRAKTAIRQWFSRESRDDAADAGRRILRRALARQRMGWQRLVTGSELSAVAADLGYGDVEALCSAVGSGALPVQKVVVHVLGRLADEEETDELPVPANGASPNGAARAVTVAGRDDVMVNLAQCCAPVLGDDVLGFITRGRGISVHRSDCANAEGLRRGSGRTIDIAWDTSTQAMFRVTIQVVAAERPQLLRDITTVLGDLHVNILSAQTTTQRHRVAKLRFTFELADITYLSHIIAQVRKVESVRQAFRVGPSERD